MKETIVLIGGGGHCASCIDVIEQEGRFAIAGIVDVEEKLHRRVLGYEIMATDDDLVDIAGEYDCFFITLGQIGSPGNRVALFDHVRSLGGRFPVIISPHAYVSPYADIDEGTIIMHHAIVNAGVRVGTNCIINTKALLEHDTKVGNHCHIATGAVLNGAVNMGDHSFFGSNAVAVQGITIGKNARIHCNACVSDNVPDGHNQPCN